MSKLWGGRFGGKAMGDGVMEFTSSLGVDNILASYDCEATKIHVGMLAKCGYISGDERDSIVSAIDEILEKIKKGAWEFDPESHEDIHSAVQEYVEARCPKAARKMHTGRSRNEQVVNDVRLYCRDAVNKVISLIAALQKELVRLADKCGDSIVPGYTHLNRAQPVLFSHLLMAYVEMLERDKGRMKDAASRSEVSVMGSGALAGSALELDRQYTADRSGFKKISTNSIDSVSDRDFMAEIVSGLALIAVHLSRISEDLILYSIPEFGFLDMGSEYCTGSSLMPQKRNPDVLEIIRGRTARVISDLNSLMVLMKGLPHSYNRDLQEDKMPLFGSVETVSASLEIMKGLVGTIVLNPEVALNALESEFIYATDIAEYLVRKGVAFKDAHDIVGAMVNYCSEKNMNISDLSLTELRGFSDVVDEDVFGLLNPRTSVDNKRTPGSTNPREVEREISRWKKKLHIK